MYQSATTSVPDLLQRMKPPSFYVVSSTETHSKKPTKKQSLHRKQLSADSTSSRIKYDFNSSPNLRPRTSSPITVTKTETKHRRPPPKPPSQTAQQYNTTNTLERVLSPEDKPIPKPRNKRGKSLNSHQIHDSIKLPSDSSTLDFSSPKPSRRRLPPPRPTSELPPPLPPPRKSSKHRSSTLAVQDDTNIKSENYFNLAKQSYVNSKPPGIFFTPPPARSYSLKIAAGDDKPKVNKFTPAILKPLPLIPSLTKPLPPIPASNVSTPSPFESEYAFIPGSLEYSCQSPTFERKDARTNTTSVVIGDADSEYFKMTPNKPTSLTEGDDNDDDDVYLPMEPSSTRDSFHDTLCDSGEYVKMAAENVMLGYPLDEVGSDSEYIPMSQPIVQTDGESSMATLSKSTDNVADRNDCAVATIYEDEYIKMDSNPQLSTTQHNDLRYKKITTMPHPEPPVSSLHKQEKIFDFNSMYIDLDMVSATLAHSGNDHVAKHPKSRFLVSSTKDTAIKLDNTRKPETKSGRPNLLTAKARTLPNSN